MSELRNYQVDHLLLLVGSNPVPNAVAGKLLTVPGGTISLIYSADGSSLAERLEWWFGKMGYSDIRLVEVEESNATSVSTNVAALLDTYEREQCKKEDDSGDANKVHKVRLGLNYTGGTKVMSVHAYRALESWIKDKKRNKYDIIRRDSVFSYLDARTLEMRFDPRDAPPFYVGLEVDISIRDLLKLHNWEPINDPITVPVLPESAQALLAVHSNPTEARKWTEWQRKEFFPKARKRVPITPPIWVSKTGEEVQEQLEQLAPNDRWKSKTNLQKLEISWPDLSALKEAMSKELGQESIEMLKLKNLKLTAGVEPSRRNEAEEFCKWLGGTWLESAVLCALQDCAQKLHLNDYCMDIKPRVLGTSGKELFQFDVAAIRGYQLFAFSCTTESGEESGGRWLLKQKLFEAYVRARQMGGDEACAALVCCMPQEKAEDLEDEMQRDIVLKGRVRIFGREQLADLAIHIGDWVSEQSRDRKQNKEE